MSHLRISVPFTVRPREHESVKVLARRFSGVNDYVTAVNVQCVVCHVRGRANSRLVGKGKNRKVLCAECARAS